MVARRLGNQQGRARRLVARGPGYGAVGAGHGIRQEADDTVLCFANQVNAFGQIFLAWGRAEQTFIHGRGAHAVQDCAHRLDLQQAFQQFGFAAVALHPDVQSALGQAVHQSHEIVFPPVRALGEIKPGNAAVKHVAAGHAGFHLPPGKQVGDNFSAALFDDLTVVEEGKFHAFGIAVNGLAVGAVKGIENRRVGLEIHSVVGQITLGQKSFDDFAADAVRRGIQGNAHVFLLLAAALGGGLSVAVIFYSGSSTEATHRALSGSKGAQPSTSTTESRSPKAAAPGMRKVFTSMRSMGFSSGLPACGAHS